MSFAVSPCVIPGTPRGVWGRRQAFVTYPTPFFAATAALLLIGCGCTEEEAAQARAVHDGGHDDARVEASSGTGGRAPVDTGAGGVVADARADAVGGQPGDAQADVSPEVRADSAPAPASLICGDALRGLDEECDDGNQDDSDFCTRTCDVHDALALAADNSSTLPFRRRELSRGYHVIAGNTKTAAFVFADTTTLPGELRVALFTPDGTRIGGDAGIAISDDWPPVDPTDGVVTALPGNTYAIVWTALPSGSSSRSVAMRSVDGATGALGAIQSVSTAPLHNQESVDAVWTKSELVVSWMDRTDPLSPQGRIRRYDASLNALGNEENLSTDGREEILPTLAATGGSYAALWYENAQGFGYDLHVRSGASVWAVPEIVRFASSRMHLAALDTEHLLGLWTQTDHVSDGGFEVPHLYGAVFDTGATGAVSPFRIEGKSAALTDDPTRGDNSTALAVGGGSAFVAWFSDAGLIGGGLGALVFKEMPWRAGGGGLDLSLPEEPLARAPLMQNSFFADEPALGVVPWTTGGTLFSAWEDRQRVFGRTERKPDIVAQFLPVPIVKLGTQDGGADAH